MQTARDVSNEFRDLARTSSREGWFAAKPIAARAVAAAESTGVRPLERMKASGWRCLPFKYSGSNAELMLWRKA